MPSILAVCVLAWVLMCDVWASYGQLSQRKYKFSVPSERLSDSTMYHSLWKAYMECQACIDTYVGASRVSLLNVELGKLTLNITATPSGFDRLFINCDEETSCLFLTLKKQTLSMVQKAIKYIPAAFKSKHEAPVSRPLESKDPVRKVVCLAHRLEDTYERKMCLRDASGSKSIGEFVYATYSHVLAVYVLQTLRNEEHLIRACQTEFHACQTFVEPKYLYEICKQIHHTKLSKDHGSVTISGGQPFATAETEQNKTPAQQKPYETGNYDCIGVELESSAENRVRQKIRCMKCLAYQYGTLVHSLHFNVAQVESSEEFLLMKKVEWKRSTTCDNCSIKRSHDQEKCYEGYHNYFDTVSTEDRISMYMPQSIREKFVAKENIGCLLVATQSKQKSLDVQNVDADACTRCLLKHIGHSALSLSNDRSLMAINTLDQKKELLDCVHKEICQDLVFIPDEMCSQQSLHTARPEEVMEPTDLKPNVASLPTQPDRLVSVVRYKYDEPACLVCLALLYEVLLISIVEKYVWMVKREESEGNLPICGSCWRGSKPLEEEENIKVSIHMMRPISANQVLLYVHGEGRNIEDLKIERPQKMN